MVPLVFILRPKSPTGRELATQWSGCSGKQKVVQVAAHWASAGLKIQRCCSRTWFRMCQNVFQTAWRYQYNVEEPVQLPELTVTMLTYRVLYCDSQEWLPESGKKYYYFLPISLNLLQFNNHFTTNLTLDLRHDQYWFYNHLINYLIHI